MAASAGSIILNIGFNAASLTGALKKIGAMAAAAFTTKKLIDFGASSLKLASDLQEVQNVVDVTFGSMAGQINDFSKSALKNFGLSELSAKKYASTMGAILKSSGISSDKMLTMSKGLTELTGNMSSFYNIGADDMFTKIQSGISGEIEPLRRLGINMSVANMEAFALSKGIDKSWKSMNQAEQTLLRYNYLMAKTKDAQGDFARTSGSWANQTRLLSEQWNIFKTTMGQGLLNVLTPVVKWLNWIIAKLQVAAEYFKAFTEVIFGSAKAAGTQTAIATEEITEMGGAVKKAGKKVKGSLAPFDELNLLTTKTAESADDISSSIGGIGDIGSMGSVSAPKIDTNEFTNSIVSAFAGIKTTVEPLLNGISDTFRQPVTTAIDKIKNSVTSSLAPALTNFTTTTWTLFKSSVLDVLKSDGFSTAIDNIKDAITNLGTGISSGIKGYSKFIDIITDSIKGAFPNLKTGLASLMEGFLVLKTTLIDVASKVVKDGFDVFDKGISDNSQNLKEILTPAFKLAGDTMAIVGSVFESTANGIKTAYDNNIEPLKALISDVLNTFMNLFNKLANNVIYPVILPAFEELKNTIGPTFDDISDSVSESIGIVIDIFKEMWERQFKPGLAWITGTLLPKLKPAFDELGKKVGDSMGSALKVVKNLFDILKNVLAFVRDVFVGDMDKAWTDIGNIFKGAGKILIDAIRVPVNAVIRSLNDLFDKFNSIKIDIPKINIPGIGEMGGGSFSLPKIPRIPEIPALASGGLVSSPTLAMVGDNRGARTDPEVVSPLSKLQDMLNTSMAQNQNGGGPIYLTINLGTHQLAKLIAKDIRDLQRQTGEDLLLI